MSERVDAGTQPSPSPSQPSPPRVRTKVVVLLGVVVALLLAGGVSYFASASPDGLNRVAQDLGFGDQARDSATAGSPLADYGIRGVDHPALSGGIAGIAGVLVVLGLGSGLAYVVRRRTRTSPPSPPSTDHATGASTVGAPGHSTDG